MFDIGVAGRVIRQQPRGPPPSTPAPAKIAVTIAELRAKMAAIPSRAGTVVDSPAPPEPGTTATADIATPLHGPFGQVLPGGGLDPVPCFNAAVANTYCSDSLPRSPKTADGRQCWATPDSDYSPSPSWAAGSPTFRPGPRPSRDRSRTTRRNRARRTGCARVAGSSRGPAHTRSACDSPEHMHGSRMARKHAVRMVSIRVRQELRVDG